MSTILRSALVALVLTSASAAMAAPAQDTSFTDQSQLYGGHAPNSQDGIRAFWDNQARHGN